MMTHKAFTYTAFDEESRQLFVLVFQARDINDAEKKLDRRICARKDPIPKELKRFVKREDPNWFMDEGAYIIVDLTQEPT